MVNSDFSGYDEKVDIWGLGICFYYILKGKAPFSGIDTQDLKQKIIENKFESLQSNLSNNFLNHCFFIDKEKRLGA